MKMPESTTINVFLVDDHRTILWGLERLVESAEPRMRVVGTAASSAEMFAKLPDAKPDLILLDLDLGGENGLDCLPKLQQQTRARVLVLTGSSDPAVHQQAVAKGARGVVHKQVLADVILRAIESVHHGEIWLDHATLGRLVTSLSGAGGADPRADKLAELTPRERAIVDAIVREKGAPHKVIAEKLNMSEHTLRNHLTAIYGKLGLKGRMELYIFAAGQH